MSTPCSYGMKKNGVMKTTYYHWDGYIEYFGKHILTEIKHFSLSHLCTLFDKIQMVDLDSIPTKEQIDYCKKHNWFEKTVDNGKDTNWYCLLHKTLGGFRELIKVENETPFMIYFPIDKYCYGYLIDFDDNLFIVYKNREVKATIPLKHIEFCSITDLMKCLKDQISDKTFTNA